MTSASWTPEQSSLEAHSMPEEQGEVRKESDIEFLKDDKFSKKGIGARRSQALEKPLTKVWRCWGNAGSWVWKENGVPLANTKNESGIGAHKL